MSNNLPEWINDRLAKLAEQGIPTESYIRTAMYCNNLQLSTEDIISRTAEVFPSVNLPTDLSNQQMNLAFRYMCHDLVLMAQKANKDIDTLPANMVKEGSGELALMNKALKSADYQLKAHPWMWTEQGIEPKTSVKKPTKGKRGWKSAAAKQIYTENIETESQKVIMNMFMEKLDMGIEGARTYFYKIKKEMS